jgi:O-antigen ligase
MSLERINIRSLIGSPSSWFLLSLALVMLALWFPFIPNWQTFIHMWRVEFAASLLAIGTFVYLLVKSARLELFLHEEEWRFIVLPCLLIAIWSAISAIWAPSWKSAIHHSLVWGEYTIFYILFRQIVERRELRMRLGGVFVVTLLLHAFPAIVEYCAYLAYGGATTLGIRFAKFGEQIVTILPLVLVWVARRRGRNLVIEAAVVSSLWLLVFCSLGRTNYLLFAAVVLAIFAAFLISRRYRRYTPRFALLCVLLVLAPIPLHLFSFFSTSGSNPAIARFTNTDALSSSGDFRKLMISLSTEMIRANPVVGIGADNFGMQVNNYRQAYGSANPSDRNLAAAESELPNHAHNEYLQMTAELGVVGLAIFCWLAAGILLMLVRSLKQLGTGSLYPFAAVVGLGAFLASSLVSSYSFRLMQNGLVFFFVLAVASRSLLRPKQPSKSERPVARLRLVCAGALIISLGLGFYWTIRVTSVAITATANRTANTDRAKELYELAISLDDENADAYQNLGMRLFRRQRFAESIPYLESSRVLGRAPSAELSYLATAKTLSGDSPAAIATMKIASELYPQSPFVLTRYATLLESCGNNPEASEIFDRALAIDRRAAMTWRTVIDSGPKTLSERAALDKSLMQIMELTPQSSIYAVVTERYIKFPEEQRFSVVKVLAPED